MKSTPSLLEDKQIFTYGFELEGAFNEDLSSEILDRLGSDGSVHIDSDEFDFSDHDGREYRSPVFNSLGEMIEHMSMFDETVYASNDSCGLHIHLKPKNEAGRKLFNTIASSEGLHLVAETHKKLAVKDPWQNRRRNSEGCEHFASQYGLNDSNIGREWGTKTKYREVRNHPQGTYEFRLFSPQGSVKDRKERIIYFFTELFEALEKIKFGAVKLKTPKDNSSKYQRRVLSGHYDSEGTRSHITDNLRTSPQLCVLSL